MNYKLFFQVAGPTVLVGVALFLVCLVGVWFTDRSHRELSKVLTREVASLQAAQDLEIRVRQLRFRTFLNLLDPSHPEIKPVEEAERNFELSLETARRAAHSPMEKKVVADIAANYERYQRDLVQIQTELTKAGKGLNLHHLVDSHPLKAVSDPCQELLRINRAQIIQTLQESARVGQYVRFALIALGLLGPVSGLLMGYGIARGLSRSIYRLSVRVHDMARHLDQKVASLTLPAGGGDLRQLDQQLQHIVRRVEEAAQNIQRQQQELLRTEQLSAVGQLAASVAHEVRNPLTSVKLLVEAAHRSVGRRPLTDEDLDVIYQEIERLEQTVQSFLDFARPPALHREVCDLREVIGQAVELVRARARQSGTTIDVHMPDQPALANVDRSQWCTVLVNLFLNALDAMPTGGGLEVALEDRGSRIEDRRSKIEDGEEPQVDPQSSILDPRSSILYPLSSILYPLSSRHEGLVLTVADTGSGIPPAMLERLFRPFASSKPTGTGLGLSISRRIVEEHGGTIQGVNRPGGGACFTLTLPAEVQEEAHAEAAGH